jgi:general secretion pathway protein G
MRTRCRPNRRRQGFTLLEVLLVVVILSVIMSLVVVNIFGARDTANKGLAEVNIKSIGALLDTYRLAIGSYPNSLQDLSVQPSDLPDPSKWYAVSKEPISPDPWGNPFEYKGAGNSYELRSAGPDGQMSTADDIVKTVQ